MKKYTIQMTSYDYSEAHVEERAFAIFLVDGVQFYLEQNTRLRHTSIHDFCNCLWSRWNDEPNRMTDDEKNIFREREREELRRFRRIQHMTIYRSAMSDLA